ncbi:his operon leader peptide [Apirhabdus apintestini]|nr:his operon leader peptide [Erwinia sp. HR93]MEA1065382.1 his operon leader peptide [Erwinia sp. HR93]WPM86017.1 his operon leader peptide [Enterobacteriaceae bacterium CA-0114]
MNRVQNNCHHHHHHPD